MINICSFSPTYLKWQFPLLFPFTSHIMGLLDNILRTGDGKEYKKIRGEKQMWQNFKFYKKVVLLYICIYIYFFFFVTVNSIITHLYSSKSKTVIRIIKNSNKEKSRSTVKKKRKQVETIREKTQSDT